MIQPDAVTAFMVMAYIDMAYIDMAYIVTVHIVTALYSYSPIKLWPTDMAFVVTDMVYGLLWFRPYIGTALRSYGLYNYCFIVYIVLAYVAMALSRQGVYS